MKFKVNDQILQIVLKPDILRANVADVQPAWGTILKIHPKTYRIKWENENDMDMMNGPFTNCDENGISVVKIELIEQMFILYTPERFEQLLQFYTSVRSEWGKLYQLQMQFTQEDTSAHSLVV